MPRRQVAPDNDRRYGALDERAARRYGYHLPPDPPVITRRDRIWDTRETLPTRIDHAAYGPTGARRLPPR